MIRIRTLLLSVVILFANQIVSSQTYDVTFSNIEKSPKPSFEQFLGGLKAWEFGSIRENGVLHTDENGGDFMYAYLITQFIKFMS